MFKWIRNLYRWMWWSQRAIEFREKGYDCDAISMRLVEEMKAKGLEPGKDFVAVNGSVDIGGKLVRHMCLDLHGHRIDAAAPNKRIINAFKGSEYVGTYR